jgi:hypothetical protein
VRLWDVNPASWVKQACAIVNRNFSHKEWQKHKGNLTKKPALTYYPKIPILFKALTTTNSL